MTNETVTYSLHDAGVPASQSFQFQPLQETSEGVNPPGSNNPLLSPLVSPLPAAARSHFQTSKRGRLHHQLRICELGASWLAGVCAYAWIINLSTAFGMNSFRRGSFGARMQCSLAKRRQGANRAVTCHAGDKIPRTAKSHLLVHLKS